jgi:hypothetical protein
VPANRHHRPTVYVNPVAAEQLNVKAADCWLKIEAHMSSMTT